MRNTGCARHEKAVIPNYSERHGVEATLSQHRSEAGRALPCTIENAGSGISRTPAGYTILGSVLSIVLAPCGLRAEDGVWSPSSTVAQVNVACTRVYSCGPGSPIVYNANSKLVVSAPKLQWGVCSASAGPADSCNECLTNPPDEPCTWSIVPK